MEKNLLLKEVHILEQKALIPLINFEGEIHSKTILPYEIEHILSALPSIGYKTLYLKTDIGLTEKVPKLTGVYLPTDFSGAQYLDVILYFHGLVKGICGDQPEKFRKQGVMYYWQSPTNNKKQTHFPLREALREAARKAILIVPTLGTNAQKDFGKLNQGGYLDRYLNRILKTLEAEQLVAKGAPWRHLIVAGHSAGGNLMQKIISLTKGQSRYVTQIQECWGLDCFYYGSEGWKTWLMKKQKEQRLLALHTGNGKSAINARQIKQWAIRHKIDNVFEASLGKTSEHCAMVSKCWKSLIENCPFLEKT